MRKSIYLTVMITILLTVLFVSVNIPKVKADGTIYIRADGSIEPETAPISTSDNTTYTFTDNINGSLIVERNDVVIEGKDFTLNGQDIEINGLYANSINNLTVTHLTVTNFERGIMIETCSNVLITQVTLMNNAIGFRTPNPGCSNLNISYNIVKHNEQGIYVWGTCLIAHNVVENNTEGGILAEFHDQYITQNQIYGNYRGIVLFVWAESWPTGRSAFLTENDIVSNQVGIYGQAQQMVAYHNNFIDNLVQTDLLYPSHFNFWSLNYPFGGNYWSDYTGNNTHSGPYQNETGSDAIGDEPYTGVQSNGLQEWPDTYPLIVPWTPTTNIDANITKRGNTYPIVIFSNATISDFQQEDGTFRFRLSGETDTVGSIEIIQPVRLNASAIKVFLNDTELDFPSVDSPRSISTDGISYFIYAVTAFNSSYDVTVTFPLKGDLNADWTVDIYDAVLLANAFGSNPVSPNWNAKADINGDNSVDIFDAVILASNFGTTSN